MIGLLLRLVVVAVLVSSSTARATAGTAEAPAMAKAAADAETTSGPALPVVDLNTASVEQLCSLPGIGPRKAEAIVSLREKRPFTRVSQLLLVKGIGPKTLARLKPRLTVGPPPAPPQALMDRSSG